MRTETHMFNVTSFHIQSLLTEIIDTAKDIAVNTSIFQLLSWQDYAQSLSLLSEPPIYIPHSNFVLGNAQAQGWPIVYCSDGFCELTGYSRANVMAKGSGCKFLYGPETSDSETAKISEALVEKRELKTEVQMYRKNGTPFWCLLDIVPIKNEKRDVVLFLVSHKDITKERAHKENRQLEKDGQDSPSKNSGSDASSDEENENETGNEGQAKPDNYDYGRRRSRAVLYHISGQLNKQNKTKSKLQHLNMIAAQMPEYKVQEVKKSRFIIVHYGIFKIGWDWLILLCTFYIAFMVPFNAAFMKSGRFKDFVYLDAVVEVLFALDIFLNFRTTFLNKSGQVVYESRTIAINYIKGWFLLDLLAAIPFDLLYAFSVETATMVHLLKVARLLRLARLLQKFERYNQYSVLVLGLLLCMFALIAHWLACIWYAIGRAELDEGGVNWTVGWLYELSERLDMVIVNSSQGPDMMTSYITALYFTCSSLTSVGFGNVSANTNVEKIFSVCAMLLGAIMHAVVFGNVTTIIQRMYSRRAIFHSKTKDLKDFFRIHRFPRHLRNRMRDYFQAMWSINNGIDFKEIVKDFPVDMRGEIGLHLHREILSLPIFQLAPPGCLKTVSLQTERFVCGPGEFIMRKGDAVNYLYYVCSGSLEVLKDDQVVAILGKGDIFGTDLDYDDPVSVSGCDVRSLAYCEFLCIQVKGLVDSLLMYPDYAETFNTELPNDLTYNVRDGHEDHSDDESSTAAPVITLPSISEDEEENEDNNNDIDISSKERLKRDSIEEDPGDGKGNASFSPLLTQLGHDHGTVGSSDWLAGRSRLPNGHIGSVIRDEGGPAMPSIVTPTISSSIAPVTTHQPTHVPPRPKPSNMSSLALRRTASCNSRLMHRRGRDKLRSSRTLPTLTSVSSERSMEQVMVHTLQMELEGTRDTVIGLERRLDDLHDDLASISRNVDSLLKLVAQNSCSGNLFLSSQSLHQSCIPSPSPNPNTNQTPSFYFSQSTDSDNRDSISLQSMSSQAPDTFSVSGTYHRNEQFLSPFQAPRGRFGCTSPIVRHRVNFSPSPRLGYFPSFSRQSSLTNIRNDRIPAVNTAPDLRKDKSGSISMLHSRDTDYLHKGVSVPQQNAVLQELTTLNETSAAPLNTSEADVSSLIIRSRLQRPSNLSPLQPRRTKSLFAKPSRSFTNSNLRKHEEMAISATKASSSLGIHPTSSDQHSLTLTQDSLATCFHNDNYKLTQLEPCDAKFGHCEKADNLRMSCLESSSISSPSPGFDLSVTMEEYSPVITKQPLNDNELRNSRDQNFNDSPSIKSKDSTKSGSPKQSKDSSSRSPSPTSMKNNNNKSQKPERTKKSLSPKSLNYTLEASPTVIYPPKFSSPKSQWLQNLAQSLKRSGNSPRSGTLCTPEDIEFIDCEPFPEHLRLCPSNNNYSASLSQLPVFSTSSYPNDSKRSRSSSISSLSQSSRKSFPGRRIMGSDREHLIAPLSKAESFSDMQDFSEV